MGLSGGSGIARVEPPVRVSPERSRCPVGRSSGSGSNFSQVRGAGEQLVARGLKLDTYLLLGHREEVTVRRCQTTIQISPASRRQ